MFCIPDEFEVEEFEEDKKALEDKVKDERFNVCDVEKFKTESEDFEYEVFKENK